MSAHIVSVEESNVVIRRDEVKVRLYDDLSDEVKYWLDGQSWIDGQDYQFSSAYAVGLWFHMVTFEDPQKATMFKLAWGGR